MNAMAAQHACSCPEVGTESGNVAEFVPKPGAPSGHGPRGNIKAFAMQCCGGTETYSKSFATRSANKIGRGWEGLFFVHIASFINEHNDVAHG